MTTPTQKAALDALGNIIKILHDCEGHQAFPQLETLRAFILAHPDAAPEKVEGLDDALQLYEQHGVIYDDHDHNDRMCEPMYIAARLYSQGHVAAPNDKAIRAGRAVYDFTFNDGDTLGTLIHQSEYINGNQPLDAQLRDVRLICQQIAEAALSPKADVSAPSDEELIEKVAAYRAFCDFIFESLDIDPETSTVTVEHPTKGKYPISLKKVTDDIDEAMEKFTTRK